MNSRPFRFQWACLVSNARSIQSATRAFSRSMTTDLAFVGTSFFVWCIFIDRSMAVSEFDMGCSAAGGITFDADFTDSSFRYSTRNPQMVLLNLGGVKLLMRVNRQVPRRSFGLMLVDCNRGQKAFVIL